VDINGDGRYDVAYAGDNLGNMWKFDLTDADPGLWTVAFSGAPLFTAQGPKTLGGARDQVQPISAAPAVRSNDRYRDATSGGGTVPVRGMMVSFGTGRNVDKDDADSKYVQTLYSVLDNTRYSNVGSPPTTNKRLKVASPGGSCPDGADCVPVPKALGTGVTGVANLAKQTINTGGTIDATENLSNTAWTSRNGWYADLPATSERLLRPAQFYDASNILAVYTQVPPKGTTAGGVSASVESCDGVSAVAGQEYLTLINIMDGKRPSVQLMDINGDERYNSGDGGASRMALGAGPHTLTGRVTEINQCPPGATDPRCSDPDPNKRPKPRKGCTLSSISAATGERQELACLPEQSLRPSWRQLQ
jgi:type IV pilus assembly protein PilY1